MKLFSKLNKFILLIFWVTLIAIIGVLAYVNNTNDFYILHYSKNLKKIVKQDNKDLIPKLMNDHAEVYLPKTQFKDFNFNKKKINFLKANDCFHEKCYTFFLETYKKNLLIIDKSANLYFSKITDSIDDKNFKKISTNLKLISVTDLYVNNNDIYISGYIKNENNEFALTVYKSSIKDFNNIEFNKIFQESDTNCTTSFPPHLGGKMKYYKDDNLDGLLLTTGLILRTDNSDIKGISDESICGKVLILDNNDYGYKIFSKGHRNILGLYVDKKLVLATENGPRGGDEINNVFYNKNYGWPIASYGTLYNRKKSQEKIHYLKNHKKNNFEEPVFAFTPSIGISEIIKLPNSFSDFWQDNFLIGSLNKKTLYRVKFDDKYSKLLFFEEIFVGDRIRDIVYLKDEKMIIMSLEFSGSIGIIQNNK